MRKTFLTGLLVFGVFLMVSSVHATPMDLSTFTVDGDVSVSAGTVTIDETSGLWSSYYYDDFFAVDSNALELSFNFSLSSGVDDFDWLVMIVDDGINYWYDFEITGSQTGSHVFDLTPYQGDTISLTFGLEADMSDWAFGSVATFSNFDISYRTAQPVTPAPEPGTLILLGMGLLGIARFGRSRFSSKS